MTRPRWPCATKHSVRCDCGVGDLIGVEGTESEAARPRIVMLSMQERRRGSFAAFAVISYEFSIGRKGRTSLLVLVSYPGLAGTGKGVSLVRVPMLCSMR